MASLAPRSRPRTPRGEATVRALLAATSEQLALEGLAAMTTTGIAEAAGVGVGTLYAYYPGKEALVFAVAQGQRRARHIALAEPRESPRVEERVYRWVASWLRHEQRAAVPTPVLRAAMRTLAGPADAARVLAGLEASLTALEEPEARFDPFGVHLAVRVVDALVVDPSSGRPGVLRHALTELVLAQVRRSADVAGSALQVRGGHGVAGGAEGNELRVLAKAKALPAPHDGPAEDGAHPERQQEQVLHGCEPGVA